MHTAGELKNANGVSAKRKKNKDRKVQHFIAKPPETVVIN
jgi:hypothetical protein